jgi:hypothetical protein
MEEWRDITYIKQVIYNWSYQISNYGRVKNSNTQRVLSHGDTRWYKQVILYNNWTIKAHTIHSLVMNEFIWYRLKGIKINHKDWDKSNNNLNNLEYCTHSDNQKHSYRILWNKTIFQTNHPRSSLWKFWKYHNSSKKISQYTKNWDFIKKWYSIADIIRDLWISHVWDVCRWKQKTAWGFKWEYY